MKLWIKRKQKMLMFFLLSSVYILISVIDIQDHFSVFNIIKNIFFILSLIIVSVFHSHTIKKLELKFKQNKINSSLAKIASWEFDKKRNKLKLSNEVFQISGIDPLTNKVNSDTYKSLIIPGDKDIFEKFMKRICEKKETISDSEYTILNAIDCTERIHKIKAKYLKKDTVTGIIQDVTEWKNIETRLFDNINKFALLFDQMPHGIVFHKIIHNKDDGNIYYKFTDINDSFLKLTGMEKEKLLGNNICDITYEISGILRELYNNVIQNNRITQFEDFFPDIKKYLTITAFSFKQEYLVAIVSDITEKIVLLNKLRESENRFRNIVESAEAGYFRIGMDGCFVNVNESWLRMHGYDSKDEVIGRHFVITQVTDDIERAKENVQKILKGEAIISGIFARKCRNGETGYHTFSANSVIDNGRIAGLEGFIIDVTEQKRAEEEHNQLIEQFHQSEKMSAIGQLASGIAHDFNNQLTGIMGYADLIRSKVKHDKKISKYTENMIKSLKSSSELVRKLLQFSYKGRLKTEIIDVHNIIEEVIALLKHSISKRIKIVKELHSIPLASRGDPSLIQNAILNISINACDAMPHGGQLTLSVETASLETEDIIKHAILCDPGEYVRISISDTGCGMNKDTVKRIFEPFYTTKKKGKGTGMGLAAVYTTIKKHNGSVSVISNPGEGTIFNIYLPLKKSKITEKKADYEEITDKQDATILFIDDEDVVCNIACEALQDIGYNVILSKNGEEAVKLYKEMWKKINLVVIDMIMPGIDGYETYSIMHEINPDINAIFSSGFSINREVRKVIKSNIVGFIPKPYTSDEIKNVVISTLKTLSSPKNVDISE